MCGLQQSGQAPEEPLEPLAAAQRHGRALVAAIARRRLHLLVDPVEQALATVAATAERRERLLEPAPVEVRIEVAEAGREAASHLSVCGRVITAPHRAAAMAQPEQRLQLVDELLG